MLDRGILTKYFTHKVSLQISHPNFPKIFVSPKMTATLNFSQKHQNSRISKTLLDRAISTKFLTHRVSLQSSHPNFQKKFLSCQNGGRFELFAKIAKQKNAYISKTVLDRAISAKFLTRRDICRVAIPIFKKFLSRQIWWPF